MLTFVSSIGSHCKFFTLQQLLNVGQRVLNYVHVESLWTTLTTMARDLSTQTSPSAVMEVCLRPALFIILKKKSQARAVI